MKSDVVKSARTILQSVEEVIVSEAHVREGKLRDPVDLRERISRLALPDGRASDTY
jgi:hypothetical protein